MSQVLKISRGLEVVVDDDTYPIVRRFSWHVRAEGTVVTTLRSAKKHYTVPMYALVLGIDRTGQVGYLDGNKLNLTRGNLQPMSHPETIRNQIKHRSYGKAPTSSRFKGVSWAKREQKWRAVGRLGGKNIDIGFYDDEEKAAHAFDEFVREHYAPWGALNFPQNGERGALTGSRAMSEVRG